MSAGAQGGGLQVAPEGSSGSCRPAWSGLLQPPFSAAEGDRWLEASHRLIHSELLFHPDKFQIETVALILVSIRKGDLMFSVDLKDAYFQIPIHSDSQPYLRFVLEGQVFQFRALYFGLFTAP